MIQHKFFQILHNTWKKINDDHIGVSGLRFRVNNKFINSYLTDIFETFDLKCVVSCDYNWIKSLESRKIASPFWKGLFTCKNCKTKYSAEIQHPPNSLKDDSFIQIIYDDQFICQDFPKSSRTSGEKRKMLANEIMLKGYSKLKSENIIYNSAFPNNQSRVTDSNMLYKIKFEINHKERLTSDVLKDAEAAKYTMAYLIGSKTLQKNQYEIKLNDLDQEEIITPVSNSIPNLGINGYIHDLMMNPFGYILISEIQIKMWLIIQQHNPVWFFDATSNINKKLPSQKSPDFYAMVCHDEQTRQLIPIFEFVTTDQTEFSINIYLQKAKNLIKQTQTLPKDVFIIAPIIVVDFSWAMINSINNSFNNCSTLQYLHWTFEIVINKNTSPDFLKIMSTRVYICAVHFLKTIIKKVKKYKDDKKNILFKMFVYAFTLIQNSTNIDQMIAFLKNIHNIFCNKFHDQTVFYSMALIRDELKVRGLNQLNASQYLVNIEETITVSQPKTNKVIWFKDMSHVYLNEDDPLVAQSPYRDFFDSIISTFDQDLSFVSIKKRELNPYYNIELFGVIKNILYLTPLWTGLMLDQCKKQHIFSFKEGFSRLDNNPVENYFGHLKDDILKKMVNLLTSEIASHLYLRIKAKYIEFYLCKYSNDRPKIVKRLNIKAVKKKKTPMQVWKKNVKLIREKGIYYKSIHNYGDFERSRKDNLIETADFAETFSIIEHKTHRNLIDMMDLNNDLTDQMDFTESNNVQSTEVNEPTLQQKMAKNEYDHASRYYFLKFKNKDNGCYANAVIQSLLGLGNKFFTMIKILPNDYSVNDSAEKRLSSEFWKEILMFISKYESLSNEVLCSLNFRKIIDQINPSRNEDTKKYASNTQQDSYFFLQTLIQSCNFLESICAAKKHQEANCQNCKKMFIFKDHRIVLLGLTRAVAYNKQISSKKIVKIAFDELFLHNNNNITTDYKCDTCGHININLNTKTFYDFDQTLYLVLRIELSCNDGFFLDHVKITKFNPDRVKIPNSDSYFRVMTAIMFYPNDIDHPRKSGGHYTCLKRIENSGEWIEIDDLKMTQQIYTEFVRNLSNVYILFLEKLIS